jgi:DNA gyrase inhibitor GyrI
MKMRRPTKHKPPENAGTLNQYRSLPAGTPPSSPRIDFAVALSQHVDASSGGTEAFAKVSTEMLFQFPFACATNSSCM